jgi:predicted O-methyltransferase YrrM
VRWDDLLAQSDFTQDWFTIHIPAWDELLKPLEGRTSQLLELGSFEGLSTCYLLWRLPESHVTCIDSFDGWFADVDLENRFDRNVALIGANRVRKLVGKTHDRLPELVSEEASFDFIYVDASHHALDVLCDAALSWQVLTPGGLLLFDDYALDHGDPLLTPGVAVDAFRSVVASCAEEIPAGGHVALRRLR